MPVTTPDEIARIDYSAFPHIIDRIMYFTGKTALQAWRRTCRHLKKRAETQLAAYFTISEHPPFKLNDTWYEPCKPYDFPKQALSLIAADARVRVLDLDVRNFPDAVMFEAYRVVYELPDLKLVRIRNDSEDRMQLLPPPGPYACLDTVYFVPVTPSDSVAVYPHPFGGGDVFVNLRYGSKADGDDSIPGMGFEFEDPDIQSTFYFFMTPVENLAAETLTPGEAWLSCLRRLVEPIAEELVIDSMATYVFVGDPEPGANRSVVSATERALVKHYLKQYTPGKRRKRYNPRQRKVTREHRRINEEMAKSVKFMTFWEMRKAVGDEMYELIMEPNP
jgi:hypothetical protein